MCLLYLFSLCVVVLRGGRVMWSSDRSTSWGIILLSRSREEGPCLGGGGVLSDWAGWVSEEGSVAGGVAGVGVGLF